MARFDIYIRLGHSFGTTSKRVNILIIKLITYTRKTATNISLHNWDILKVSFFRSRLPTKSAIIWHFDFSVHFESSQKNFNLGPHLPILGLLASFFNQFSGFFVGRLSSYKKYSVWEPNLRILRIADLSISHVFIWHGVEKIPTMSTDHTAEYQHIFEKFLRRQPRSFLIIIFTIILCLTWNHLGPYPPNMWNLNLVLFSVVSVYVQYSKK